MHPFSLTEEQIKQVSGGLRGGTEISMVLAEGGIESTMALGEEGGTETTMAFGEEGGMETTLALGEEGGLPPDLA